MAQYKPGTVSLVNGSDTIHFGEGVSLISDGLQAALASGVPLSFKRKGESATYQITNVLTEVSAQISPSYAGATATAVEYQIQRDFTHRGYPEINGTDADWPYQVTVAHRKISDDVQDIVGKTAYARLTSAYGLDINGPGTYDLSQNTTITDDVQGVDGVVINPGSYTLTFQGNFTAPPVLQFTGPVAGLRCACPEWFGADGITDDGPAFAMADASLQATGGIIDCTSHYSYKFDTTWELTHTAQITGKGRYGSTTFKGKVRTAPNGQTCSSAILRVNSHHGISIKGILFDGGKTGSYVNTDFGDNQSLLEITNCNDVVLEDLTFTGYFGNPAASTDETDRIAAIFLWKCNKVRMDNVEYRANTYGDLLRAIDCTELDITRVRDTFSGSTNATALEIRGILTEKVRITRCDFANQTGSAINLGGKGKFHIESNTFANCKGIDVTDEGMWSAYGGHPDMYGLVIKDNIFTDMTSYVLQVGDTVPGRAISSHGVVIEGNVVNRTSITYLQLRHIDGLLLKGNVLNGVITQLGYNTNWLMTDNISDGKSLSGSNNYGIYLRAGGEGLTTPMKGVIRHNIFANWEDGPIGSLIYAGASYTDLTIEGNDFYQPNSPTGGKYLTIGSVTYPIGTLIISANRLNNTDYIPMRGTDTDLHYTTLDLGEIMTKVGVFTRDMSLGAGNQSITGFGFKPRAVLFTCTVDGVAGMASWGFTDYASHTAVYDKHNITANSYTYTASRSLTVVINGSTSCSATITSFDSDGITLAWTVTGSPTGTLAATYLAIK